MGFTVISETSSVNSLHKSCKTTKTEKQYLSHGENLKIKTTIYDPPESWETQFRISAAQPITLYFLTLSSLFKTPERQIDYPNGTKYSTNLKCFQFPLIASSIDTQRKYIEIIYNQLRFIFVQSTLCRKPVCDTSLSDYVILPVFRRIPLT
jgi:hypothetical protein